MSPTKSLKTGTKNHHLNKMSMQLSDAKPKILKPNHICRVNAHNAITWGGGSDKVTMPRRCEQEHS